MSTPAPVRLKDLHQICESNDLVAIQLTLTVALLKDDSDVIRHEAAFLIADLARCSRLSDVDAALSALIQASKDNSVLVRHEVALAFASFDPLKCVGVLCGMARDISKEVRDSVVYALEDSFICVRGIKD